METSEFDLMLKCVNSSLLKKALGALTLLRDRHAPPPAGVSSASASVPQPAPASRGADVNGVTGAPGGGGGVKLASARERLLVFVLSLLPRD